MQTIHMSPHEFGMTGAGGKRSLPSCESGLRGTCRPGEKEQLRSHESSRRRVARSRDGLRQHPGQLVGVSSLQGKPFPLLRAAAHTGLMLCLIPAGVGQVPGLSWPNHGGRGEDKTRVWWVFSLSFLLFSLCGTWNRSVPSLRKRSQGNTACPLPLGLAGSSPCQPPRAIWHWARSWTKLVALLRAWHRTPESSSAGNAFCPEEQLEKQSPSEGLGQWHCKSAPGPSAGDQDRHGQCSLLARGRQ